MQAFPFVNTILFATQEKFFTRRKFFRKEGFLWSCFTKFLSPVCWAWVCWRARVLPRPRGNFPRRAKSLTTTPSKPTLPTAWKNFSADKLKWRSPRRTSGFMKNFWSTASRLSGSSIPSRKNLRAFSCNCTAAVTSAAWVIGIAILPSSNRSWRTRAKSSWLTIVLHPKMFIPPHSTTPRRFIANFCAAESTRKI